MRGSVSAGSGVSEGRAGVRSANGVRVGGGGLGVTVKVGVWVGDGVRVQVAEGVAVEDAVTLGVVVGEGDDVTV